MSDTPEDEGQDREKGWIGVATGAVLVAVVTGAISFATAAFSEDVARCTAATNFFIGFTEDSLYSKEERERLIALYLRVAEENCLGE